MFPVNQILINSKIVYTFYVGRGEVLLFKKKKEKKYIYTFFVGSPLRLFQSSYLSGESSTVNK